MSFKTPLKTIKEEKMPERPLKQRRPAFMAPHPMLPRCARNLVHDFNGPDYNQFHLKFMQMKIAPIGTANPNTEIGGERVL